MIPLAVPNLVGNERAYLNSCIDTTFVSSVGQYVDQLEDMVSQSIKARGAVSSSSGTAALHLALMAVGVGHNDLVIVPSFTFIASANAIAHCGAQPWLFDVTSTNWTLDPNQVRGELGRKAVKGKQGLFHRDTGQRIAALMPVYTLGNVADMDEFAAIAQDFELPLIADAACAIGARYKERDLGEFTPLGALSFNGNKTITCGGGGMVFGIDSEQLADIKHVSTTARVWPDYDFDKVGYNYRMTNLQAAVGCAQMEHIEEFVARKRAIRAFYNAAFADIDGIESFPVASFCQSSCWFSGVVVLSGNLEKLHSIEAALRIRGVDSRTFWKPVHHQIPYRDAPRAGSLRVSETLWERILTLPCSTGITDEELTIVVSAFREIIEKELSA